MFDVFNISFSGMIAEKIRISVISNNIANINTTGPKEPYRRKLVVFQSVYEENLRGNNLPSLKGVKVVKVIEDLSPFKKVYDPSHPDVDKEGYVSYPNIDISQEMVDLISATRSYEANLACFYAVKQLLLKTLEIGV
ncbi:MAG: flagellar basal body rod protein FlgC [bacterium]|nr:flagellar basal body rod protein FlgC [bacterium]MDW8164771.1 flagellar basal body rod protein FlgC [Candidatus Omnitrophota bacterium]